MLLVKGFPNTAHPPPLVPLVFCIDASSVHGQKFYGHFQDPSTAKTSEIG